MTEAPPKIADLLQQGLFHHRQGDLRSAIERYSEVLRIDPDNADALYYAAVIACQEDQLKEGLSLARRSLEHGPQARTHNLREGVAEIFREDERILEAQQKAIDDNPDHIIYNLNIDAGSMWARRLIDRMIAEETIVREAAE